MYDDITYTKADSNIKVGDSISLMYVPKTGSYYIKDNFPQNYNSVEVAIGIEDFIIVYYIIAFCGALIIVVFVIITYVKASGRPLN